MRFELRSKAHATANRVLYLQKIDCTRYKIERRPYSSSTPNRTIAYTHRERYRYKTMGNKNAKPEVPKGWVAVWDDKYNGKYNLTYMYTEIEINTNNELTVFGFLN